MALEEPVVLGLFALEIDRTDGERILSQLKAGGRWEELTAEQRQLASGIALIDLAIARAVSLRFTDPEEMLSDAHRACILVEHLPVERYTLQVVNDVRAQAWAEYGNALRISDDLAAASQAFAQARDSALQGTRRFRVISRVLTLYASLLTDLRRFEEAISILENLEREHRSRYERAELVRVLVQLGHVQSSAHEPKDAILTFFRALPMLEPGHELLLSVVHGLARNLVEVGLAEAARALVQKYRRVYRRAGKLTKFRLIWLEGLIALGLGEQGKAEGKFQTARLAFLRHKKLYEGSLVALDLALLLVRQERLRELTFLLNQVLTTFRELGVGRETLAALILLRKACKDNQSRDYLRGQIEALANMLLEFKPAIAAQKRG